MGRCKRHGMIAGCDGERCYQCMLESRQPPTVSVSHLAHRIAAQPPPPRPLAWICVELCQRDHIRDGERDGE
jgi:hypothetical protein